MGKFKVAVLPLVALSLIIALARLDWSVGQVAHFPFLWDILLGAALGALLALLPSLSGFGGKRNAVAAMFWVGGFATMLLIFYQYISLVAGVSLESFAFIANPGPRMRIVEGAMMGFLSFVAGRGRV